MLYDEIEKNLIEHIDNRCEDEILFLTNSDSEKEILNKLKDFDAWEDKTDTRPDFISNKYKMLLEVMQTNDYEEKQEESEKVKNDLKAYEGKRYKEIKDKLPDYLKDKTMIMDIHINKDDLGCSKQKHIENFQRVVEKHKGNISGYYENFSKEIYNQGLIFYVWDTSEDINYDPYKIRKFLNVIMDSGADYFVWHIPFTTSKTNPFTTHFYSLIIADVKELNKKYKGYKITNG